MENMRSHHAKAAKEILDTSGIRYLYLPPCTLDLNPIEICDQKKVYLRKLKVRTATELPDAIEKASSTVCPSDCLG